MGQYYKPIILDDDGKPMKWFDSHYYADGLKLMEHSYWGPGYENGMVQAVESYLAMDAALPLIWSGDYDDEELWNLCEDSMEVRFTGYTPPTYATRVPPELGAPNAVQPIRVTTASHPFIVNVTRQEYVDKREVRECDPQQWPGHFIHPLPLLTVNSNGRGGGDYRGDWQHVARWSDKSRIAVSATAPIGGEGETYVKLTVSDLAE